MPWVTRHLPLPACSLLACRSVVVLWPLAHALCILSSGCETQETTSIYPFTLSAGRRLRSAAALLTRACVHNGDSMGGTVDATAISVSYKCLCALWRRFWAQSTVRALVVQNRVAIACEHCLLPNSAHLSWISWKISWQQCVDWGLLLGCSSGWQRLQGLKCRFARMGSSLQLEMENLTFSGSILSGCRKTLPGPEHEWHWKCVWHYCAVTVQCILLCMSLSVHCPVSSKSGQGGTGGCLWLTESKKGRSQECRRCSDVNQLTEMGLALLQHCGSASMATKGRRMSSVTFPLTGSVKEKTFDSAALKWCGLLYYLFCHSS